MLQKNWDIIFKIYKDFKEEGKRKEKEQVCYMPALLNYAIQSAQRTVIMLPPPLLHQGFSATTEG